MNRILVGIIMGSDSDLPVMKNASDVLLQFEVEHEIRIVSAHRTVHEMISYGESAKERGLEVLIAGAGGAAARPSHRAAGRGGGAAGSQGVGWVRAEGP